MCPNGHKPTGNVRDNNFFNCDSGESNAKAIFVAPDVPGCAAGLNMIGNNIYNSTLMWAQMGRVAVKQMQYSVV